MNRSEPWGGTAQGLNALFCSDIRIERIITKRQNEIRTRSLGFFEKREKNKYKILKFIFKRDVGARALLLFYHVPDTSPPPARNRWRNKSRNKRRHEGRARPRPEGSCRKIFFILRPTGSPAISRDNVTVQLTRPIYFWGPRLAY